MERTASQLEMIRDALAVHEDGCCTKNLPRTLRTGLESQIKDAGLKADVRSTEAPQRMRDGSGPRIAAKNGPTDAQIKFAESLLNQFASVWDELDKLDGGINTATLIRDEYAAKIPGIADRREFSKTLDTLKRRLDQSREELTKRRKSAPSTEIEDGMYVLDGVVYRVVTSRSSGKPYASKLEGTSFNYAPGAVRKLLPEHRMTLEDAQKYGKLYGVCAVCGCTLTNPKSIERGIGPICAEKF